MKQNGFLNSQYLNKSIKYTAFNVIVSIQYSKQNLQDSWQCEPYKVESLILRRSQSACQESLEDSQWVLGMPWHQSHTHAVSHLSQKGAPFSSQPRCPLPSDGCLASETGLGLSTAFRAARTGLASFPRTGSLALLHRRISQHSTCKRPPPG